MTARYVSAAEFKREHQMGHKKFQGLVAAGKIVLETIPGSEHPVINLARYEAARRREGELDAERGAA